MRKIDYPKERMYYCKNCNHFLSNYLPKKMICYKCGCIHYKKDL